MDHEELLEKANSMMREGTLRCPQCGDVINILKGTAMLGQKPPSTDASFICPKNHATPLSEFQF